VVTDSSTTLIDVKLCEEVVAGACVKEAKYEMSSN
jgi:hypothetical protein